MASKPDRRAEVIPSPLLVQAIENNLLLKQVMEKVGEINKKQDINHLVSIALRDHNTIERVDELWTGFGNLKFLLRVIAGSLALIPIVAALLTVLHFTVHWP